MSDLPASPPPGDLRSPTAVVVNPFGPPVPPGAVAALALACDDRLPRFGFSRDADVASLASEAGQRHWHVCLWWHDRRACYACTLTRRRWARFFPAQTVGLGPTPVAALTDAIVLLCDPECHEDLEAAVERAVRWRLDRYPELAKGPLLDRRRTRQDRPLALPASSPVTGFAYRPLAAVEGRRGAWYPAGEVLDRLAGERLRVWTRPASHAEVRTERVGTLEGEEEAHPPAPPATGTAAV